MLQQMRGWSSQAFFPKESSPGFKTHANMGELILLLRAFVLMSEVLLKPLLWAKQPEKSAS